MSDKLTYKKSGVDVEEGRETVSLIKKHIKDTFSKNVISDIGGFGGLFSLDTKDYKNPVLVSGTDGVGTKLNIAFKMDKHDTIGIDLVAMCVNDILCQGAKPLFFLDYIATGKLKAEKISDIVKGISQGCKEAKMSLIGGETAEMPDFYKDGEYDLSGFAVGIVDRENIIDGKNISSGDVLIGIPSNGIHSNGYSLVRRLFFKDLDYSIDKYMDSMNEKLGEELLKPTRIYTNIVSNVLNNFDIKGMCHITGGGFYENIPRVIPNNLGINIDLSSWERPTIFKEIQSLGNIDTEEMYKTFNMGIGYIFIVDERDGKNLINYLNTVNEEGYIIGKVDKDTIGVKLCQG